MKDWGQTIFGTFIGVLGTIAVLIFQRYYNRKKEALELHNTYLDTIRKMDEHAKVKMAEMETKYTELEEQAVNNAKRYEENIRHYMQQITDNTTTILNLQKEIDQLRKQVNGNH